MAAELSNLGMVKLLLKNGADPNILSPPESETALLIASWHGQIDIVKVLLRAGAYVNPISNRDETALLVALRENHMDIAKELIYNGADIKYVIEKAVTDGDEQLLKSLLSVDVVFDADGKVVAGNYKKINRLIGLILKTDLQNTLIIN